MINPYLRFARQTLSNTDQLLESLERGNMAMPTTAATRTGVAGAGAASGTPAHRRRSRARSRSRAAGATGLAPQPRR